MAQPFCNRKSPKVPIRKKDIKSETKCKKQIVWMGWDVDEMMIIVQYLCTVKIWSSTPVLWRLVQYLCTVGSQRDWMQCETKNVSKSLSSSRASEKYRRSKKTKNNNYILTALNKCTSALQPGVSHSPCSYRDRACVGAQDGEDIAR